jgi:outer membrane protein OmpA-like peptidoglycan-associated protein
MLKRPNRRKFNLVWVALAAGLSLPAGTGAALAAEEISANRIIEALKPAGRITRGLTATPNTARSAEDAQFVNSLRNKGTRSLTSDDREKIASIARKKPSIDLEINFEFNSDTIGARALPQVRALGEALSSDDLKDGTFLVAGHTDAKGGEDYNQNLSERRADAVKRFLSEKYGIDTSKLMTAGYGKTQLKTPSNPLGGENRRVQLVNMTDK